MKRLKDERETREREGEEMRKICEGEASDEEDRNPDKGNSPKS